MLIENSIIHLSFFHWRTFLFRLVDHSPPLQPLHEALIKNAYQQLFSIMHADTERYANLNV